MERSRCWCGTLNNFSQNEYFAVTGTGFPPGGIDGLDGFLGDWKQAPDQNDHVAHGPGFRYAIVAVERGESGTPHLQCYFEWSKPLRVGQVKTRLGSGRWHVECRRGTVEQAVSYCEKSDPCPWTYGTDPRKDGSVGQGARSDLAAVAEAIRLGAGPRQVFETNGAAFIRYHRGILAAVNVVQRSRSSHTNVVWLFGKTGAGKSRKAHAEAEGFYPGNVGYVQDPSGIWFDGVCGSSKAVVWDEFNGKVGLPLLLRILDRYPLQLPVKGSWINFQARILWITSQFPPQHYFGGDNQWSALRRRLEPPCGIVKEMINGIEHDVVLPEL